jgi:3-dehydroquinate dehydratase II
MSARLMILNGPNLNLLGVREPHIYGSTTLAAIEASCREFAQFLGASLVFRQSNHEGELVDLIQSARTKADAVILNPAAYSFTSIAILDALKTFDGPFIEVHISNIHARDELHRHSILSSAAKRSSAVSVPTAISSACRPPRSSSKSYLRRCRSHSASGLAEAAERNDDVQTVRSVKSLRCTILVAAPQRPDVAHPLKPMKLRWRQPIRRKLIAAPQQSQGGTIRRGLRRCGLGAIMFWYGCRFSS